MPLQDTHPTPAFGGFGLKDISAHINETGGTFPTNIVVNFRKARGLRFVAAGPSSDDPTVLGTLHLPNTYKCAWVIDGQHRLYGFSLSDWAKRGRVPVLAFENLDATEEVKMFVDINSKQVKVPRSLLVELEPELPVDSNRPDQWLSRLHSQIAVDLSESDDSPLWDRVQSEWVPDTSNRPITLPQLASAIAGSQLVGSVRTGVFHPGHLFLRDIETTKQRVRVTLEEFFSLFAEGANEHWALERSAGGFLCTNLGIGALLRLFNAVLTHVKDGYGDRNFDRLSPETIVGTVTQMMTPLLDWFNNAERSDMNRFRGRYGSGAPLAYSFALMEIVKSSEPTFDPPGLAVYIEEHDQGAISTAHQLVTEIEDSIRELTFTVLDRKYGGGPETWWRDGVPQPVRVSAAQKSETSEEGGQAHQFLDLLDYKKIAEFPRNWQDFDDLMSVDRTARSKAAKLSWFDRLNRIRNRVSHSGRRHVSPDEIDFLEEVWGHVGQRSENMPTQRLI